MAQKDPILSRAEAAYLEHILQQQEQENELKKQARVRKIRKLQHFLQIIDEDVPDESLPQVPQIARDVLTFSIAERDDEDDVHVSYRCNYCGKTRTSSAVHNLVDIGEFLFAGCPCNR